jgi:hypothetical protein
VPLNTIGVDEIALRDAVARDAEMVVLADVAVVAPPAAPTWVLCPEATPVGLAIGLAAPALLPVEAGTAVEV